MKLIPNARLKIYPGGPHGLTGAHEQEFNDDLLAFACEEAFVTA